MLRRQFARLVVVASGVAMALADTAAPDLQLEVRELRATLAELTARLAALEARCAAPAPPNNTTGSTKNYLNLSLDTLAAAGSSSATDVARLEAGGHDPNQRGFTLQNVEVVLDGAIDPYFKGQANLIWQLDESGASNVELEEAYLTSTSLPHNLQLKAGTFLSEFGRINTQHPHAWDFVDQPLVNGRFLGPDGLRGPGARLSWLAPTPFYLELALSLQNSQGETAFSFRNRPGEELFGRPIVARELKNLSDMLLIPRVSASFDLNDTQTLVVGASSARGPNGTGPDTDTSIHGVDLFWKWKAAHAEAGFPFAKLQLEALSRRYEAAKTELLPRETLRDRGAYAQALWGFRRGWVAGLRGDWVRGDRAAFDPDPQRDRRWRAAANLTWFPTEFSKFRLQWNHDRLTDLGRENSLWLQAEFLLGAHAAHKF